MTPAAPEGLPRTGEIIAGKYRVAGVIGRGGMGVVVAADHVALRQRVAIKLLLPDAGKRVDEASSRFLREAQAAASIKSEHVARILDVGTTERAVPYIVMEYLQGADLGALLASRGTVPPHEAVGYVLQTCDAIGEAHALGIVHRDLKPSNLFVTYRADGVPVVKVLDFGLATASLGANNTRDESFTRTDVVLGSIHYMSPEQLRGLRRADERSDIWSLGVILYELVSGRRPFEGTSVTESMLRIGTEPAPPIGPPVPPALEGVIACCLEKDPARRPRSIADLALMLEPFAPEVLRATVRRIVSLQNAPASGPMPSSVASAPRPPIGASADTGAGVGATRAVPSPPRRLRSVLVVTFAAMIGAGGALVLARFDKLRHQPSTRVDADRLASFAALPRPSAPSDSHVAARIALGARLFSDPKLSKNGDVACTNCHPLDRYGADGLRLSRGSDGLEPPRNTLGIYNVSGFFALSWDGRQANLVDQAKEVLASPRAMASSREGFGEKLKIDPAYVEAFAAAFPDEAEPVGFDDTAVALAAYEATLFSRGRWDAFLEGDANALSAEEKHGFNRFVDVGCVTCHFGPNVGATMFQKVGLVKAWPDSKDRGRYEITKRDADLMVFRVPSLRNVAVTGPYFHDGSVASLDTAIRMMAHHQLGKEIDDADAAAIGAWLACLTGDPPPAQPAPASLTADSAVPAAAAAPATASAAASASASASASAAPATSARPER